MYRDIIGKPEKIEVNDKTFWIQEFEKWDGTLKAVRLYDEDGDFICEFDTMENLIEFAKGVTA